MGKIKIISGGFIQLGESLENLRQFKSIKKGTFGMDEHEGGAVCGIEVTPLHPSKEDIEKGVDGRYFIATYNQEEMGEFDEDFNAIKLAFNELTGN
jgi:hypothetical protein